MPIIITGYYCQGGATTPNDMLCNANHYCVAGSNAPTPCPTGSFSSNTRNIDPTNFDMYSWILFFKFWRNHWTMFCRILLSCGSKLLGSSYFLCPACHFCPGGTGTPSVSSWGLSRQHGTNRLLGFLLLESKENMD